MHTEKDRETSYILKRYKMKIVHMDNETHNAVLTGKFRAQREVYPRAATC